MLLFKFQSSFDTQWKPFCKSQHSQFLSVCIVFGSNPQLIPGSYPKFPWSFDLNSNVRKRIVTFCYLDRFLLSCVSYDFRLFFPLIIKKMLVKIFQKRDISSMRIELYNSVNENNWNMTTHEQDTSRISRQWLISIFLENIRKPEHYSRNKPKNSIA